MSAESRERTMEIISDHHDQLAEFARKSYGHGGRGVIQVSFPNVPPGATVIGSTTMKYIAIDEMHRLAATLPGNEDAPILVRMVETYDPASQAVVTAAIEGENPISIKMKLELPCLVNEPDVVH